MDEWAVSDERKTSKEAEDYFLVDFVSCTTGVCKGYDGYINAVKIYKSEESGEVHKILLFKDRSISGITISIYTWLIIAAASITILSTKCNAQQTIVAAASAEIVNDISLISLDSTNNIKVINNNKTYYSIQTEIIQSERTKEYAENKILIYN